MNHLRCAVLVCTAAISGCASVPSTTPYDIDALGESLARTVCGDSSPKIETVPNPHVDGVLDTIERRDCILGSSTMYVSTQASDPSGLAVNLEIHQPGSGVPEFLEMGSSVSGAIRKLGQPASLSGERATYVFGHFEDKLTIDAPSGIIRSLAWSWSVD